MSEDSESKNSGVIYFSQVFAGIGIGMLMGLVIGLSASPVAKSILGTLAGLLGVFLGLQDNIFGKKEDQTHKLSPVILSSLRAGSFGVACTLAIILGLFLRTNDKLGMTPTEQVKRWTDAGYDSTLAHEIALYEKLNKTSKQLLLLHEKKYAINKNGDTVEVATTNNGGLSSTVLFSKKEMATIASMINPQGFEDANSALEQYRMQAEFLEIQELANFADAIENNIEAIDDREAMLLQITILAGQLSSDDTNDKAYKTLRRDLRSYSSTQKIVNNNQHLDTLRDYLDLIDKLIEEDNSDSFMEAVADLLFEIPAEKLEIED